MPINTVWHETVAEMQMALDAFLDGLPVRPKPQPENQPQPIAA